MFMNVFLSLRANVFVVVCLVNTPFFIEQLILIHKKEKVRICDRSDCLASWLCADVSCQQNMRVSGLVSFQCIR